MPWVRFKKEENRLVKSSKLVLGGRKLPPTAPIWEFQMTLRFPYEIVNSIKQPKDYLFNFTFDFGILDLDWYDTVYRIDWGDGTKNIIGRPGLEHLYIRPPGPTGNVTRVYTVRIVSKNKPVLTNKLEGSHRLPDIRFGEVTKVGDFNFEYHKYEYTNP